MELYQYSAGRFDILIKGCDWELSLKIALEGSRTSGQSQLLIDGKNSIKRSATLRACEILLLSKDDCCQDGTIDGTTSMEIKFKSKCNAL